MVFALSIGEVAARYYLPPPVRLSGLRPSAPRLPTHVADPDLGWRIAPNNTVYRLQASGRSGSVDARYSIHDGRRVTSSQAMNGPAVIAAGCSFTFGLGVDDESTWPWLLQERLPDYQVINTGVNGYGADQALLSAEQVAKQSAGSIRLVVLGFGDFQIERNRSTQGMIYFTYPRGKPLFVLHGDGVEYRGLVRFWYPGRLLEHSALFMGVTNRIANLANRVPSHEGAREVTARLISEFSRRFQERGARLVVVMLPHAGDQSPQSKADREFMAERLRRERVPAVTPEFPRLADGRLDAGRFLIPSDEVHPNREYNLLVANEVAKFIRGSHDVR